MIMATKKLSIEELEKQYLEAEKNWKTLHDQFVQAKKEEEAAQRAKLAAEKDARYKEVIDAYENFEELRSKYVNDYGRFTFEPKCTDGDLCDWVFRSMGLI